MVKLPKCLNLINYANGPLPNVFHIPYYSYQGKRDKKLKIGINHELPFWKFMKTNV